MSSKRKNTPTKLAQDEMIIQREKLDNITDGDSNIDSDGDSESNLTLHIVTKPEQFEDLHSGLDSPERPQSKKQRILQSVMNDSESESEIPTVNNNNNLTKPTNGGVHRKSMDSVLQKLSNKAAVRADSGENPDNVEDSVKACDDDGRRRPRKGKEIGRDDCTTAGTQGQLSQTGKHGLLLLVDLCVHTCMTVVLLGFFVCIYVAFLQQRYF